MYLVCAGSSRPSGPAGPTSSATRADQQDVALADLDVLRLGGVLQVLNGDPVIDGQRVLPLYLATSSSTPRPTMNFTLAASPCTVPTGLGGGMLLNSEFSR